MRIRNVRHKGLRRFIEANESAGLAAVTIEKVRNILSFLQAMTDADELRTMPGWRAHQLTGDRKGTWSLTVTKNWRVTFRVDETDGEIVDLDYEDYH